MSAALNGEAEWQATHGGSFAEPVLRVPVDGGSIVLAITAQGLVPVRLEDAAGAGVNQLLAKLAPELALPATDLNDSILQKCTALLRLAQPAAQAESSTAKVRSQLEGLSGSTNRWLAEDAVTVLHAK